MEYNNNIESSSQFYGSFLADNKNEIFTASIESIKKEYNDNHYFCTKCHKFPFIKFCKDRKNIKLTCSCFNNKKISIEEFLKNSIENRMSLFLSENNLKINNENVLKCNEHNKQFKGFSKFFLNNYCEDCDDYTDEIYDNDIIRFDDIRIEEKKIEELIEKINDISREISEEKYNKFNKINDNILESLSEEEEKRFKKLIKIIINDYINYPNFSHFFNINNLLYFYNIEDISIEKEENFINNNLIEKNEPIIIEYINNTINVLIPPRKRSIFPNSIFPS